MPPKTLGADLRALRKSRGVTLAALAQTLGRSVGWLSQIERDLSTPRMADLYQIARALDVPLSLFFGNEPASEAERGLIVRADKRRVIGTSEDGLSEALLSPDLTDDFEVIHSTFAPGSSRAQNHRRGTQELAYLVTGRLDVWIEEKPFTLNAGDSLRLRGQNYRWSNPYDEPACAVWIIAPPVY
jgi:transcriptional regulator with XRE-family HTH domain